MSENTFTVTSWDERIIGGEENQPRFAYAHTANRYQGVIDGDSVCDYLLYYAGEGHESDLPAPGFERVEGVVDGRKGTFVTRLAVRYDAGGIHGTFDVMPGSGTGELAGITGRGSFAAPMGTDVVTYEFDYRLG